MNGKRIAIALATPLVIGLTAVGGARAWLNTQTVTGKNTSDVMLRVEKGDSFEKVLKQLQDRQVIASVDGMKLYARYGGTAPKVKEGTYRFRPGLNRDQVFRALEQPIIQRVRIPEGWWVSRVAKLLESKGICSAQEYIELTQQPAQFADVVNFALPKRSLEGFLFPDTYDFPPMMGARAVIERQLRTFEQRTEGKLDQSSDLARVVNIAAMVELEAKLDRERPVIAGVIENRLRKPMRLQIDATVLYALGEWKVLPPGVVNTIQHPYNTYVNDGLPPGPIGSPGLASILAAANPQKTNALYYMAMPDGSHLFTSSYSQHLVNIRVARAAARRVTER
jgi:UPF0755 protein